MAGHGKGRPKKHHEEEHENHERWAVSYSDMMTVLMALFLVLFAMSNVDQKKYLELKTSLAEGFGSQVLPTDGGSGIVDGSTGSPVDLGNGVMSGQSLTAATSIASASDAASAEEAAQEASSLKELQEQVDAALQAQGMQQQVTTTITERGLVISVAANNIFFASGSAQIEPAGLSVLDVVAPMLLGMERGISVEGHANSLAINDGRYANNWELSSARATSVLLRLKDDGVAPARLQAVGMGDAHPLFPDDDPRALEGNRRVDIVLLAAGQDAAAARQAAANTAVAQGARPGDVVPAGFAGAVPDDIASDIVPTADH